MTNEDVRRQMAAIADARDRRRAELDADARPPVSAADRLPAPFRAGDRVLDLRGGREGTVFDVGIPDRAGLVRVAVRFDDGGVSMGPASDLLARPRPPVGRP
jgi:hypothetical protein